MSAERLKEAEAKAQGLLDELNEVEKRLSSLSPADPERVQLKNRKNDILPRYRGAKEHVKNLRRVVNSVSPMHKALDSLASPQKMTAEIDRMVQERPGDDDPAEKLRKMAIETLTDTGPILNNLYQALVAALDRDHNRDEGVPQFFTAVEVEAIERYLSLLDPK